ncbi:hypothetical protein XENOCAPTIV_017734 [Xenoophorus captivus]|uniref:Uncharacterized protein n=1 Tax=Xenoophorus captivus TaxID=1517983 RepID=A0ABV0S2N6_9TELE
MQAASNGPPHRVPFQWSNPDPNPKSNLNSIHTIVFKLTPNPNTSFLLMPEHTRTHTLTPGHNLDLDLLTLLDPTFSAIKIADILVYASTISNNGFLLATSP